MYRSLDGFSLVFLMRKGRGGEYEKGWRWISSDGRGRGESMTEIFHIYTLCKVKSAAKEMRIRLFEI